MNKETLCCAFERVQNGPFLINNFINNEFVPPFGGSYLDSYCPSNGKILGKVADSAEDDVTTAVKAANLAFTGWSQMSAEKRSEILMKIADLIEVYSEEFARAESRDQGKPVQFARAMDVSKSIRNFRAFARKILHQTNDSTVMTEPCKALNFVLREPIGVAGIITSWNSPLSILTLKTAPAIAAGNSVVAKPSEVTSVTAWLLAHVFVQAGLPPGVVNIVIGVGSKTVVPLVRHPDVTAISFTGSTAVGTRIAELAAPLHKKLTLEMGGKNACIVFEDADLEKALPIIVRSCFTNQGEICYASSRIFVHQSVMKDFTEKFVNKAKQWKVGPHNDINADMGPLVSLVHLNRVKEFVDLAKTEGCTILCGNEPIELPEDCKNGYYMRPTVITDVDDNSQLMQEEIFGPVVCITAFDSEFEVIERANGVKFGLSASIWSTNVNRVHRVAEKLKVGVVWCNCWMIREFNMPFGGIKASGVGAEGVNDSLDFFTQKKTVCIKID